MSKTSKSIYVEVEYFYNGKHAKEVNIIKPVTDYSFWPHESVIARPGLNAVNIKLERPAYPDFPKNRNKSVGGNDAYLQT